MKKIYFIFTLIILLTSSISATTFTKIEEKNSIELPIKEKEKLPEFLITGHTIYIENKNIIVPVYYSLIAFLALILILNIIFKRPKDHLIEEAEELLEKEESNHLLKNKKEDIIDKVLDEEETELKHKKEMESIPEIETDSDGKEMEEKIKKEETEIDEKEVFKESEEKLVDEVKKEIKEEKINPQKKESKGQPAPLNEKEEKEDTEKLIKEAKELEKKG